MFLSLGSNDKMRTPRKIVNFKFLLRINSRVTYD